MAINNAITAITHALAGVYLSIMALITKVDQGRVLLAVLAVVALYRVTQGAISEVPISGATRPRIAGQATCPASLSTGAAGSEPQGHPWPGRWWVRVREQRWRVAGWPGGVPRVPGGRVDLTCAHCTRSDECIYGGFRKARLGQGGARTVHRAVPEPVPGQGRNQCHNSHNPTSDIRHPAPGIRTPPPVMYPGYYVTRCPH